MLRVGRQCKTKPKRDEYVIDRSESNNEQFKKSMLRQRNL